MGSVAYLGQEEPFLGIGLAAPSLTNTGDPVRDGRILFLRYGCAACHGLTGQGGAVGKDITDVRASVLSRQVRSGPSTMPAYSPDVLPDQDLEKIIAFLQAQAEKESSGGGER